MFEAKRFPIVILVGFIAFWFNSYCCQWVRARVCLYVNELFKSLSESPKLMAGVFMQLEQIAAFNTKGIFPGRQAQEWLERNGGG